MTPFARFRPSILDRYIIREIVPPTGLGFALFTFILLLNQVTLLLGMLISRGADLATVARVFVFLLPSILALTIPMAFLLGILLAFGRLASDSEIVALRASGISPATLLRPVILLSLLTGGLTLYDMAVALPAANQAHRQIVFTLLVNRVHTAVKPRVFSDDLLPGKMTLYISDISTETGLWHDVFIYDSIDAQKPRVILARSGHLVIDESRKSIEMHLENGTIHSFEPNKPDEYDLRRFTSADLPLPFDQFFPQLTIAKGDREMTLGELSDRIAELRAKGKWEPRYAVEWHKKFAIPAACLVFGLLGLGLSLGSKKEARSAAFGLSIAIIFIYYVLIRLGEQAGDTGLMAPLVAMWGANIVLGTAAVFLLVLNHREAAFDPLDISHYTAWIPRIRRGAKAAQQKTAPPRPPRPVVVVKFPRISIRFPGILDRYIGRAYISHFFLVLTAFWSFFVLGEFLDLFDDVQNNHVRGRVLVHYFAFHAPFIVHLIAPFAVLVATLTTFGILSRRNEITAMKAGGISVYRTTVSVIALGFACSGAMLTLGEFLLPYTNRIALQDWNVIKGRPPQSTSLTEHRWIMGRDNRIYNYDYMADGGRNVVSAAGGGGHQDFALYGLSIFDVNPKQWDLRERLFVAQATWNGASYDLVNGWRRGFVGKGKLDRIDVAHSSAIEEPRYFKQEERESDTLSFIDLRQHIRSLRAKGLDVIKLRVKLHQKLAFPLIGVVMTLIGIPFAFVVGRRGALYGIAVSIVMAMVLWAGIAIFEALGNNGLLTPLLAAWAPNLLFASAGLYLMLTLET